MTARNATETATATETAYTAIPTPRWRRSGIVSSNPHAAENADETWALGKTLE